MSLVPVRKVLVTALPAHRVKRPLAFFLVMSFPFFLSQWLPRWWQAQDGMS